MPRESSPRIERAQRLQNLVTSPGWDDLRAIAMERIADDATGKLISILDSRPDTLTGKTAVRLASRRKAILDLFGEIEDEIRVNLTEKESQRS